MPSQPLILGRRGQAKVDTDTTGTRVQTRLQYLNSNLLFLDKAIKVEDYEWRQNGDIFSVFVIVTASTDRGWLETLEAGCIIRGGCIPTPRGRPVSSDTHHPSLYTGSTNGHGINKWTHTFFGSKNSSSRAVERNKFFSIKTPSKPINHFH